MRAKILSKIRTVLFLSILIFTMNAYSQTNPPPPPGGSSGGGSGTGGSNDNRNGGGAPIGGGLLILLGMGGVYGGIKGYRLYQKKKKSLLD